MYAAVPVIAPGLVSPDPVAVVSVSPGSSGSVAHELARPKSSTFTTPVAGHDHVRGG